MIYSTSMEYIYIKTLEIIFNEKNINRKNDIINREIKFPLEPGWNESKYRFDEERK